MTLVSSDRSDDLARWSVVNGIQADNLIGGVDLRRAGFRATPTVVLATATAAVSDLVVGDLSGDDVASLSSRLRGESSDAVVRNQYAPAIGLGEAARMIAAGATRLLVVGRSAAKPNLPQGALHLPYDEIVDRAAPELDLSKPIIVDCSGLRLGRCEMATEDLFSAGATKVYIIPDQGGV